MKIKSLLQNSLILIVSVVFALLAGEFALRLLKPVYDYRDRSLLFSSAVFKAYSSGAVRYFPNRKIREVAVYNNEIEYDVNYKTNNLGFIDEQNYRFESVPGKRYYAFVGDSFTAGVNGGDPWVPKLRKSAQGVEVYNFGVAATGFDHFYRLLHEMKGQLKITDIVIVAITDDFYRSYWHPLEIDGKINFCSEGNPHTLCQPIPVAGIIPLHSTVEETLNTAKKSYREIRARVDEINAANSLFTKIESTLYDDSVIFYYTKVLLDTYRRSHRSSTIDEAVAALRKIRAEYPLAEIHLIHLPQKYEVITKHYHVDVAPQIEETGVKYYPALERCQWGKDMFFPKDGHPNQSGYENISKCVTQYLFSGSSGSNRDQQNHSEGKPQ